ELGAGRELGDHRRADHAALLVGDGAADQEMAGLPQPLGVGEVGGAMPLTTLRRLGIGSIAGNDEKLHLYLHPVAVAGSGRTRASAARRSGRQYQRKAISCAASRRSQAARWACGA